MTNPSCRSGPFMDSSVSPGRRVFSGYARLRARDAVWHLPPALGMKYVTKQRPLQTKPQYAFRQTQIRAFRSRALATRVPQRLVQDAREAHPRLPDLEIDHRGGSRVVGIAD